MRSYPFIIAMFMSAAALGAPKGTGPVLQNLHVSDQGEVQMGKLAQEHGGPRAQEYGRMLVDDHSQHDQKVQALAGRKGVDLSHLTDRDALHEQQESQKNYDKLAKKTGKDFDEAFGKAMADDHEKDLKMAKKARESEQDSDLRGLLDETIPTLEKHKQHADALAHP
jgi:putative membrane protein